MMRTRWNTAAALEARKATPGEGHSARGTARAKAAGDRTQADGVGREAGWGEKLDCLTVVLPRRQQGLSPPRLPRHSSKDIALRSPLQSDISCGWPEAYCKAGTRQAH